MKNIIITDSSLRDGNHAVKHVISLDQIKHTHGVHVAEKNPKYMELLMIREGIHSWMVENK